MSEVRISERIVVDEPKNVEIAICNLTGKRVDFEIIRKFILTEKNTLFYIDKSLNSSVDPGTYSDYLWADTGFRDNWNNPIFISLRRSYEGYVGHYTGTAKELVGKVKSNNKKNAKDVDKNYSRFLNKYNKCAGMREVTFIEDAMEYAVAVANMESYVMEENEFAKALRSAGVEVEELEAGEPEDAVTCDEVLAAETENEDFTEAEKEITVGLLWEQIEGMQDYIDKLLARIETNEKASAEEIESLKTENKEIKRAMVAMRNYWDNEPADEEDETTSANGHALLGKNGKILVLGNTDIRVAEMRAIAREYFGFEKADFEFENDYSKIKNAGSRLHSSSRYVAVIFGNCPHKVAGMGDYTSIIDEFKQREDCPISIDARNEAGGLKITKQSFKKALGMVCRELKEVA